MEQAVGFVLQDLGLRVEDGGGTSATLRPEWSWAFRAWDTARDHAQSSSARLREGKKDVKHVLRFCGKPSLKACSNGFD